VSKFIEVLTTSKIQIPGQTVRNDDKVERYERASKEA
jgi:hypothetical protein